MLGRRSIVGSAMFGRFPFPTPPRLMSQATSPGPWIIGALVLLLVILHQDNWFWEDGTLVLGFLPIGLFWHACLSIAASLVWWLATHIAWPVEEAEVQRQAAERRAEASREDES